MIPQSLAHLHVTGLFWGIEPAGRADEAVRFSESLSRRQILGAEPVSVESTATLSVLLAPDEAELVESARMTLTGVVPAESVAVTESVTGDLVAASVFGRALVGGAFLG
ncbi:MAG: hypothetical protein HQM00_01795 [Magnetococcales bacterium]|nr:hypothetical protein [Magnetococcales bacterium]